MGYYPLCEGSGSTVCDYGPAGLPLATTGYGTTNPWSVGSVLGLNGSVASAGAVATLPPSLWIGWPITFAVGFLPIATPVSPTYFASLQNNVAGGPYYGWAFASYAPVYAQWNSAGAQKFFSSGYTPPLGVDTVISCTISATSQQIYARGNLVASQSNSYSNPTYTTSAQLAIGIETGTSGRSTNAVIYWCAWWNRVLSPAEHMELARNPWQLFAPRVVSGASAPVVIRSRRTLYGRAGTRGVA